MTRHVCIVGTTGSGKSTTAAVLALELSRNNISTLILDRTGEYAKLFSDREGFMVYRPSENLTVAPLHRDRTKSLPSQVEGWVTLLGHYATVSFRSPLSPLQGRVLREVLLEYYHGTDGTLTISNLVSKLELYESKVRRRGGWEESIEALISRLIPLTVDVVGKTLDRPYTDFQIDSLFTGLISIVDLSPLGEDSAKNLLSQVILKQMYEKVRGMEMTDEVRLVTIIDEAHHLAPNEEYLSIPERCAIELRKYGFSLVMLATRPSLISQNIMANCSTLISHLLTCERDAKTIAGYFLGGENSSNPERLRALPIGGACASLNYPAPKFTPTFLIGLQSHRLALGLAKPETSLQVGEPHSPLSVESPPDWPH